MTELSWIERLRLAVDVIRNPGAYIAPSVEGDDPRSLAPPGDATLGDLVGVRADLSSIHAPRDVSELLHHRIGEQLGLHGPAGRESLQAARDFASRATGDTRKEDVLGMLQGLLDEADYQIVSSCWTRSGEPIPGADRHPDIVYANDFQLPPSVVFERAFSSATTEGTFLAVGHVDDLPDDHPFRSKVLAGDLYLHSCPSGRYPALVLGLTDHQDKGKARHFYGADCVRRWTLAMSYQQHNKICDKRVNDLEDWEWSLVASRRGQERLPPRRQQQLVTTPKPTILGSWRERCATVFGILRTPALWLTTPPASTSVGDLLAARSLLEINEDQTEPTKEAATRFAARTCGVFRRVELVDLAVAFVRQLDARVRDLRERSQIWAAERMSSEVSNA
jgi:hypothetical protein